MLNAAWVNEELATSLELENSEIGSWVRSNESRYDNTPRLLRLVLVMVFSHEPCIQFYSGLLAASGLPDYLR